MVALQVLFERNSTGHDTETTLEWLEGEYALSPEITSFARELVSGVIENKDEIDSVIRKLAPAWPLEQMAAVDRNILRLAIYELLPNNKVPVKVAINEAVELAKAFGGDSSSKFINGVLSSVYTHLDKGRRKDT
jgi:N utilization substance protein B